MKVITARIEDKYLEDLEKIEKEEHVDRAEVIRKLLSKAIGEWKKQKAIELLKARKITMRGAARLAEASYSEMLDLASSANVEVGYSLNDLARDLES